jgi:transcriptional repressor NrdR
MKNADERKEPHRERQYTVHKRNGRLEPFSEEKMVRSVSRAGTPFLIAKDISKLVKNNLDEGYDNTIIPSSDLRILIVEELKNRNHRTIAESYSGYRKNLVTDTREELPSSRIYKSKINPSLNTRGKQHVKDKDNTSGRGTKIGSS